MHDRHNSAPELAEHPPPYHIMLDPSLQEHYKTKIIQQEHYKTEYLCEVMAELVSEYIVEYISAISFFFHLTYYTGCIKKSKTILKLLSIPQFC